MTDSVVYFIQSRSGSIKIGVSTQIVRRFSALATGSAEKLTLLGAVPGGTARERLIHAQFAEDRIKNEWFRPSAGLVSQIVSLIEAEGVPVARFEVHPDSYTLEAAEWASRIIAIRMRRIPSLTVVKTWTVLAREIGCATGLLQNLGRNRIASITARDHRAIYEALVRELKADLDEMANLLAVLKGSEKSEALPNVEAYRQCLAAEAAQ